MALSRLKEILSNRDILIIYPFLWIVLILGTINSFTAVIPWIKDLWLYLTYDGERELGRLPLDTVLLPIVTILGLYIVHERRLLLERLGSQVDQHLANITRNLQLTHDSFQSAAHLLINSVQGVEVHLFNSDLDLKRHLNRRTKTALKQVDDLTWAHNKPQPNPSRSPDDQIEWDRLEAEFEDIVATVSETKLYREIFILSRQSRITKLRRRMHDQKPGYFCCVLPDSSIPRLQFVIVDNQEVIFISGNHRVLCSIKHPKIVPLFSDYFQEAWKAGLPLVRSTGGRAEWDTKKSQRVLDRAEAKLRRPPRVIQEPTATSGHGREGLTASRQNGD